MASYFSYLPDIYVAEGMKDDENYRYRLVKNIFRRVRVKEKIKDYLTLTEAYYVEDFDTPATLATEFYGTPTLDWVILIVNNIIDFYDGWPKNEAELLTYVKSKYNNPDGLHHYETLEVLHNGDVLVPEGIQVNESYRVTMPDGSTISSAASRVAVSNYEWESFLNEKKRFIKLPTPAVVTFMEQEFLDLAGYDPCPELDEAGNKKTKLSIVSKFLNSSGYVGVGATPALSSASNTTFDYGPTAGVATTSTSTSTPTTTTTSTTTTTTTTTTSSSSGSSSSSSSSGSSSSSSSSGSSGSSSSSGSSGSSGGGYYGGGY